MKNALKLFGIIALAALIGLSMTACGGGGDGGDDEDITFEDALEMLVEADPPSHYLTSVGLDEPKWAAIKAAAITGGGTYRGYYYDGDIDVIFTGATIAGYDAVKVWATGVGGMVMNWPAEQSGGGLKAIEYKATGGDNGFLLVHSTGGSNAQLLDGMHLPLGTIYMSFDPDITD